MSVDLNLLNKLNKPIGYDQFVSLTTKLLDSVDSRYGSHKVSIRFMNENKERVGKAECQGEFDYVARLNEERTFYKTTNMTDDLNEQWKKAKYVEISLHPEDADGNPTSSWLHAEFKGNSRHMMSIYAQNHGAENVEQSILKDLRDANPHMLADDGWSNSGRNSGPSTNPLAMVFGLPSRGKLKRLMNNG